MRHCLLWQVRRMVHVSTEIPDQGLFGPAEDAPNRYEAPVERLSAEPKDGVALRHACVAKACTLLLRLVSLRYLSYDIVIFKHKKKAVRQQECKQKSASCGIWLWHQTGGFVYLEVLLCTVHVGECPEGTRKGYEHGVGGHHHGELFEKTCPRCFVREPSEEMSHTVLHSDVKKFIMDQASLRVSHNEKSKQSRYPGHFTRSDGPDSARDDSGHAQ